MKMKDELQRLVPKARIVVGHGQMDKGELEIIMRDFVDGKADVLLATSIIESGIDIPNANTIIIDRADRFGLADLYQLRGRVGRGGHRAYAYLLLPRQALCTGDARKRVSAIKQYTELGSGFKIAMRDLEIRGAGNLLGTQQSGHIAAIGFELYCQLLRQSIERMQGKIPTIRAEATFKADFICLSEASMATRADADKLLGAYLPSTYMESTRTRMEAYTQLARVCTTDDVDDLERQWRDRFGPLPHEVAHLLTVHKIRILATRRNITQVEISGQKLMLTRNNDYILDNKRFPRLQKIKSADKLREALQLLSSL
jgi:transcription-repair coupling factor (superfamily II helicase)